VDTDASCFDDPQFLIERHGFEGLQELTDQLFEQRQGGIMGNPDNDNAVGLLRRESKNIGKIKIKRYQTALLRSTNFIKPLIGAALQLLVSYGQNIVTMGPEYLLRPGPEVLVQLELHPVATSTNRSRDISAP
jgi:hypothetical protein